MAHPKRLGGLQGLLSPKMYQKAKTLVLTAGIVALGAVASLVFGYVMASPTFGWTGQAPAQPFCLRHGSVMQDCVVHVEAGMQCKAALHFEVHAGSTSVLAF